MVSEALLAVDAIVGIATIGFLVIAITRAFQIRKSLAIGLYRRQALWTGLVAAMYLVLFSVDYLFFFVIPYNSTADLLVSFVQNGSILVAFAWIDTTTLISRRSDPLLRNTLRWGSIRKLVWCVLLVCDVIVLPLSASKVFSGGSLTGASPVILLPLGVVLLLPFVVGAILIPIIMRRTGDVILRKHLKWLSLLVIATFCVASLYGSVLATSSSYGFLLLSKALLNETVENLILAALELFFGLALFNSARSLAPVNRILGE